ncbi:MAG: molecular chaperone GrpE, partial [Pseudonocardiales bacterium]|nr:molecular chaperone GrpE [Pseudonocardiales bacterium]
QAEYANYRKRAERDRLVAGELAVGRVLTDLLPVLDDLDRARQHGDVTGALKAIADKLDSVVGKLGLQEFGDEGDPFDPSVHEAVMHAESDAVTEPACTSVLRKGYKHGDRLLRPAMVGVTDPAHAPEPGPDAATEQFEADADQ